MIAFALLPLAAYFLLLVLLAGRRTPTLLNGSHDFLLLACGLAGLFTFGPGRLIIPLSVMTFWGLTVWVFWFAFYFAAAYLIGERLKQRFVLYHCPLSKFGPSLIECGRRLDPGSRFEGNVLHLPALGVQCTVSGDFFGAHVVLNATGPCQNQQGWRRFELELRRLCPTLRFPGYRMALLWGCFAAALFAISAIALLQDHVTVIELFLNYWS